MIPAVLYYGPKSRKWRRRTFKKRLRRMLKNPHWAHLLLMTGIQKRAVRGIQEEEDERFLQAMLDGGLDVQAG